MSYSSRRGIYRWNYKTLPQIQKFALEYTSFINEDQNITSLYGNQIEIHVALRADTVFAVVGSLVYSKLGFKFLVNVTVEVITTTKSRLLFPLIIYEYWIVDRS